MVNCLYIVIVLIINCLCILARESHFPGGAGYNLAFYNRNDVAIFKFDNFNVSSFTIEFWMKDLSFSPKSTPFSLITYHNISFSWTVYDKIKCFGQTFNAFNEIDNIHDWNHIVFIAHYQLNGGSFCKIFMNGTEIHSVTTKPFSLPVNMLNDNASLTIGQDQKEYGTNGWIDYSFQGYIDDLVLWNIELNIDSIIDHITYGIDDPYHSNIISFYRFNEKGSNNLIIDSKSSNHGRYGYIKQNSFIINDSPDIEASYGYSDAPIITYNVPTYIAITDNRTKIKFNYYNESTVTVIITKFPLFGKLYNEEGDEIDILDIDVSSYSYIYYEPFIPILSPIDSIEYKIIDVFTLLEEIDMTGRIELSLFNDDNYPPNPLSKSLNVYPISTTIIPLECKSHYGEKSHPIIKSIPSNGVLYQIIDINTELILFDPIYVKNTFVTSPRKIVAYVAPKNRSVEDIIVYSCEYGELRPNDKEGNINIKINQPPLQQSLLGTNRYGLYFDGFINFAYVNIFPHKLQSASLYVQIENHPLLNHSYIPLFYGTYLDAQNNEILCELFLHKKSEIDNNYGLGFISRYSTSTFYVYSNSNEHFIKDQVWAYIGFTFTASNSLSLMINGFQVGQGTVHPNYLFKEIYFGKGNVMENNKYFRGTITNIQLWKISFESSILYQYSLGQLTGNETGLLSFWSFDEGDGDISYDKSPNKIDLHLNDEVTLRPKWTIIEGVDFNIIRLLINESIIIPLESYGSFSNNYNSSYIITSLPYKGSLYQYDHNSQKIGVKLDEYNPAESIQPLSFWVDSIVSYSSSRNQNLSINKDYSPNNLIGSPKHYIDKISSPLYHHGDYPYAWSPILNCGVNEYEYIEFQISKNIYVVDMEIYENFNPGSIKSILSFDPNIGDWVKLYEKDTIVQQPPYYNVFKPPICNAYPFKTNRFKILFDVCSYPGNKGIEAVRVYGTETLNPSVVTDVKNRVVYVPDMNIVDTNDDSFSYSTLDCRLPTSFNIPSFSYSIKTYTIGFGPISLPSQSSTEENEDIVLMLNSYKTNPTDNSTLQHLITELPSKGMLYEVDYPNEEIIHLVRNQQGKVLFRPDKNTCGLNYTRFYFAASDSKTLSSSSEFLINVICSPNYHIVPTATFYLIYAMITLQILFSFSALIYFVYTRFFRGEKTKNHLIFHATQVIGSFIGYFYLYVILMKPSNRLCHIKIWFYHFGLMTNLAVLFVHVYSEWKTFTIKALRSDKKVSYRSHHIILFTILVLECIQLLVFSLVNKPESVILPYGENTALRISKCIMKYYSEYFLYLLKGLVLMISLVVCIILFSWTPYNSVQMKSLTIIIIIIQCTGILSLLLKAFTSNFNIIFITEFLTLSVVISLSLISTFIINIKHFTKAKEENEMGSIDMTQKMNNHSDNKSVLELIETLESKEKELVKMKKKLLQKRSKIRQLEQKILSYD